MATVCDGQVARVKMLDSSGCGLFDAMCIMALFCDWPCWYDHFAGCRQCCDIGQTISCSTRRKWISVLSHRSVCHSLSWSPSSASARHTSWSSTRASYSLKHQNTKRTPAITLKMLKQPCPVLNWPKTSVITSFVCHQHLRQNWAVSKGLRVGFTLS